MTYCVGMLLSSGMVMVSDSRTNAGMDHISTFRKMHVWEQPGERVVTLMTAGNLSISQTVVNLLKEGIADSDGTTETLLTVPSMFRAAQLVGAAVRQVHSMYGEALEAESRGFNVSLILGASRLAASLGLATRVQPIVNTVLTNVPGPQMPLYFCGAEMVNQFSLGIVQDGMTLFHGILSYNGKLSITAMSDREVMPDPAFYQECLDQAFEELKAATIGKPVPSMPQAGKKKSAKSKSVRHA